MARVQAVITACAAQTLGAGAASSLRSTMIASETPPAMASPATSADTVRAGFLYVTVTLLLVGNVVAIAADLSVIADALRLLVGGRRLLYVLLFGAFCVATQGAFCVATQIVMRYNR